MERKDKELYLKGLIGRIQDRNISDYEKEDCMLEILEMFEPFRKSLAKKFAGKGVPFEDICQVIDLKMVEAMYDYDEERDSSAIRHITSKARNGIFNFYKKEMNYFREDRKMISIESLAFSSLSDYELSYLLGDDFDEDKVIDMIMIKDEMGKLTERQKEVIELHFMSDMTQEEIAEELQINQANVSRAKKRGISGLKTNLSPLGEHDDKL